MDFLKSLRNPLGNVVFGLQSGSVGGGLFTAGDGHQELRVDAVLKIDGSAGQIPLDFGTTLDSSLHGKTNPAGPALFTARLLHAPTDTDGRHYFTELTNLTTSDVELKLDGAVDVDLPIEFPVGMPVPPPLHITIGNLQGLFDGTGGDVSVTPPNLAELLAGLHLTGDLGALLVGLDQLLGLLQAAMNSGAFAGKIPLIGDKLGQGATAIQAFREKVIQQLQPFFADRAANTLPHVRDALFQVLSGMGVLRDGPDAGTDVITGSSVHLTPTMAQEDGRGTRSNGIRLSVSPLFFQPFS